MRKAVAATVRNDLPAAMLAVRESAAALLGRDSESLNERNFTRILQDAHDADVVDLRKRGDSWEVAPVQQVEGVSEQLAKHDAAHAPKAPAGPPAPRGMGSRGGLRGGRPSAPPPELLMVGVVDETPPVAAVIKPAAGIVPAATSTVTAAAARSNGRRPAAKKSAPVAKTAKAAPAAKIAAPAAKKSAAVKKAAAKAPATKSGAKKVAKR